MMMEIEKSRWLGHSGTLARTAAQSYQATVEKCTRIEIDIQVRRQEDTSLTVERLSKTFV